MEKGEIMKRKEILLSSIFIILIASSSTYFLSLENKNSKKELDVMKKEESVLSYIENQEEYNPEYQIFYEQIRYREEENFFNEINTLLDLNYTPEDINNIYDYLRPENREKILSMEKVELKNYYSISNFEVEKIARYEEYQQKNNYTLTEAVLKVNIGLDHDFYTEIEPIKNKEEYTVLVNKYRSLEDYVPTDLKSLSYDTKYMLREQAADAFEKLVSAAKLDNIFIRPYSAYRSYEYQESLYERYVNQDGKELADTYSARPGHSEHQTGLAVDVWSEGATEIKESDAKWLQDNSYKYGFIIRYTKENESITGYIEEPWHLRYLGIEIATDVYNKGITYDEYYDLCIK